MTEIIEQEIINTNRTELEDLFSRANKIAEESEDYIIPKANLTNVRMNEYGGLSFLCESGAKSLFMSDHALNQLSTKVGVPTRYISKCVRSGRIELAQDNINSWLEEYNKSLMIREHNNKVRGILSSKYSVCDTHEILDVLGNTLDLDNYTIKGHFLSPERFHLRLVCKEQLPIPNEDLYSGIVIDSSDVGRSILTCKYLIYKKVCTNGLIVTRGVNDLFSQRHINIYKDEFARGLEVSMKAIPQLDEIICKRIESTRQEDLSSVLKYGEDLRDIYNLSDEELADVLDEIKTSAKISEDKAKEVISVYTSGRYDMTRWGYINSLTDVAKTLTLENRIELEKYASTLLIA